MTYGSEDGDAQAPEDAQNRALPDDQAEQVPLPTLTELEQSFVTLMSQHYMLNRSLPTVEAAEEEYGFERKDFTTLIKRISVQTALEEYGVNLGDYKLSEDGTVKPQWANKSLTPLQLLVANTLLDLKDSRSERKKLQELGVTTRTYNAWRRDPVFASYVKERAEQLVGDHESDVLVALIDQATAGNIKAIEYYLEFTNRYIRQPQTVINAQANQFDPVAFVVKIIEIIDEEIEDSQVALRIADRMKQLAGMYNAAGQLVPAGAPVGDLTSPVKPGTTVNEFGIELPEVVPNRKAVQGPEPEDMIEL